MSSGKNQNQPDKTQLVNRLRLANKTIWALDDITKICGQARGEWRDAMDRAERRLDAVMLASLANLSDHLAQIETRAREARQGKYEGN